MAFSAFPRLRDYCEDSLSYIRIGNSWMLYCARINGIYSNLILIICVNIVQNGRRGASGILLLLTTLRSHILIPFDNPYSNLKTALMAVKTRHWPPLRPSNKSSQTLIQKEFNYRFQCPDIQCPITVCLYFYCK